VTVSDRGRSSASPLGFERATVAVAAPSSPTAKRPRSLCARFGSCAGTCLCRSQNEEVAQVLKSEALNADAERI